MRWKITTIAALLTAISPATLVALTIAEPAIGKALALSSHEVLLVSEIFIFAILCMTAMSGTLLARLGPHTVLLLGGACYLGAIVCAIGADLLLPTLPLELIYSFIFLIGMATAPLGPATQALLVDTLGDSEHGRATAIWTMAKTVGFLSSALVAGWLIEQYGWSSQFLIGAVPVLFALPLLMFGSQLGITPSAAQKALPRFDWRGLALLASWLIPLQLLLNVADSKTVEPVLLLAGALVITLCLLAYGRHALRTPEPVLDITPLRQLGFVAAIIAILGFSLSTTGQFEILLLGEVLNYPSDWLSYRSTIGGITQVIGALFGGYLVQRKLIRYGALAGLLITALGLACYTQYAEGLSLFALIWPRAVTGIGAGMLFPLLASAAYMMLRDQKTEVAASMLVFATLFGTELGIELLGLLLRDTQADSLAARFAYQNIFWAQVVLTLACMVLVAFLPTRQRTAAAV
ncbi:MAG: MFS transporter [Gammaproteobacteria bacterium]